MSEWAQANRERLRAYKREKAREYRERNGGAKHRANAEANKARAKARYHARQQSIAEAELERLRLPESRLEAIAYGPGGLPVCLECGRLFANLSRHTSACPVRPQSCAEYRARWGYARSNPLASAAWSTNRRAASHTEAAETARKAGHENALRNLAAGRKAAMQKPRRPWAPETRQRRAGEIRPRRPQARRVPDHVVLEILGRGLPLAASAKLAGLSQTAFYRRVQRLSPAHFPNVREQRHAVNAGIFKLRAWLWEQPAAPTADNAMAHLSSLVEARDAAALAFVPYLSALRAVLQADPQALARLAKREPIQKSQRTRALVAGSAAITLAAKTFKRARIGPGKPGPKPRPREQRAAVEIAALVDKSVPRFEQLYRDLGRLTGLRASARLHTLGYQKVEIEAALQGRHSAPAAAKRYAAFDRKLSVPTVNGYCQKARQSKS